MRARRFTDSQFKGDGNLYKEAWPLLSSTTDAQKTTYYTTQLRTNADAEAWNHTGPDVSRLVEFANALEAAADDYTLTSVLREYTAAARWAAYFAVDRMIEHWDGPANFRSHDDTAWTHNFFMCVKARAARCPRVRAKRRAVGNPQPSRMRKGAPWIARP